jgi:hypothetical protein
MLQFADRAAQGCGELERRQKELGGWVVVVKKKGLRHNLASLACESLRVPLAKWLTLSAPRRREKMNTRLAATPLHG